MIPKLNPLVKTNIELRRAILRLEALAETNMEEFNRTKAGEVLQHLKDARNAIPGVFKNKDLG